jgi:hypothetical protein
MAVYTGQTEKPKLHSKYRFNYITYITIRKLKFSNKANLKKSTRSPRIYEVKCFNQISLWSLISNPDHKTNPRPNPIDVSFGKHNSASLKYMTLRDKL